jgi:hypothetical protein
VPLGSGIAGISVRVDASGGAPADISRADDGSLSCPDWTVAIESPRSTASQQEGIDALA